MGTSENAAYDALGSYRQQRVHLRLALIRHLDALLGHSLLGHDDSEE